MSEWAEQHKDDPRYPEWKKQQAERGFDNTELWSLNHTIAEYLYPRIRAFAEVTVSFPPELTSKEWDVILNKMADGFEEYAKDKFLDTEFDKVNEGLELFRKWFLDLWS